MPKNTFHKLPKAKQEAILNAFMEEFSNFLYDDASVSRVVKKLGIAKGSIYQYFQDKVDVYLYVKGKCEEVKLSYLNGVNRADYPDFWLFYRAMYEAGVKFDLYNPKESKCLYGISKNERSPSVSKYHNDWRDQALSLFESMIQAEVDDGHFRNDLSVKTMAFFMVATSIHIGDYMQIYYGADFDKNLEDGKHVFAEQKELLLQSVDEFIALMKGAFSPKNQESTSVSTSSSKHS